MIIEMKDVCWQREDTYILQDVTWSVKPGEHWAILGLNGSGKTTLLNMINGYIFPSQGEVQVLDKRFGSFDLRELRKSIGWVSSLLQEQLYVNETALEIVLSGKYASIGLYQIPEPNDVDKARNFLAAMGCRQFVDRRYKTLSQGEKQKVLIARALMASPQLLILDEPCSGLDVFSREQLLNSVMQLGLQSDGPTLLYVSHHLEEILPIFSHTLLLRKGKVHSLGLTKKVISKENLTDFFETSVNIHWQNERPWLSLG